MPDLSRRESGSSLALHGIVADAAASLAQAWRVESAVLRNWVEKTCGAPTNTATTAASLRRWTLPAILDGAMPTAVAASIDRNERRTQGIFFTPESTALRMARKASVSTNDVCFDPTVGIGSLLVAFASALPVRRTFEHTLSLWNGRLAGYDVDPHLVALTKLRILSLITTKVGAPSKIPAVEPLPGVRAGDALEEPWPDWGVLLANPPFSRSVVDGRLTSHAALFLERICDALHGEREAIVLLPDVIRCGTQHAELRHRIRRDLRITWGAHLGRIWSDADIDVFAMRLTQSGRQHVGWWGDVPFFGDASERQRLSAAISGTTLGELYTVSVGSIVPHRHVPAMRDRTYPFVRASDLHQPLHPARLGTLKCNSSSVVSGPFLAVARTSSPNDSTRIVASIAPLARSYAVENHVLVISGRPLNELRKLRTRLESAAIRELLDTRIGCRHITVGALKDLPVARERKADARKTHTRSQRRSRAVAGRATSSL